MPFDVSKIKLFLLVIVLSMFAWSPTAHAHDPVFITDEQREAEQGPFLPDARISFALYGTFNEERENRGFQFTRRFIAVMLTIFVDLSWIPISSIEGKMAHSCKKAKKLIFE